MSDNMVAYLILLTGFILLILFIRVISFRRPPKENGIFMYYKLDMACLKITTISSQSLEAEIGYLNNNNYSLILLTDLDAFIKQQSKLPAHSFLIAINDLYSYSLKKALPVLIKNHISIIIFLPILISSGNPGYQQKEVQQLNGFIFSDEFKNIFSYSQPCN